MTHNALQWITGHDTGMSSKALWSHMMTGTSSGSYPIDVDDFGRIVRLVDAVPEWRGRVGEMAQYGPEWRGFVDSWDELVTLYRAWWQHVDLRLAKQPEKARQAWLAFRDKYEEIQDQYVRCGDCDKPLRGSWRVVNGTRICWECESAVGRMGERAA